MAPDVNYDAMGDEELMERLRGYRALGAEKWSEEQKLSLFMEMFHPGRSLDSEAK